MAQTSLSIEKLYNNFEELFKIKSKKEQELDRVTHEQVQNIISDGDFRKLLYNLNNAQYYIHFDYKKLAEINSTLKRVSEVLDKTTNAYETKLFLKDGYRLDKELLKELWVKRNLGEKYPHIDYIKMIDVLDDIYASPIRQLPVDYNTKDTILLDKYVVRKFVQAIIQMVYDEMDLVCAYVGGEGLGKSTHVTQHMKLVHYILKKATIIDYKCDINNMFFNTLYKFREAEEKYFHEKFRILGLDEGNELNRQNWKDEEVSSFFQRLRRERFNQRIRFICIPVLGEMIINIVLRRMNFIFEMTAESSVRSATLEKGYVNMYIIPRGDKIYSPAQKRDLSQGEILTSLYNNLKDKSYLTGLPRSLLIKRYRTNGVWGFDKRLYVANLKDTNEAVTFSKGIVLKDTEAYMVYKLNIKLKDLGIKHNDIRYASAYKFLNRLNKYFENDPAKLEKFEAIYKRKDSEKQ